MRKTVFLFFIFCASLFTLRAQSTINITQQEFDLAQITDTVVQVRLGTLHYVHLDIKIKHATYSKKDSVLDIGGIVINNAHTNKPLYNTEVTLQHKVLDTAKLNYMGIDYSSFDGSFSFRSKVLPGDILFFQVDGDAEHRMYSIDKMLELTK